MPQLTGLRRLIYVPAQEPAKYLQVFYVVFSAIISKITIVISDLLRCVRVYIFEVVDIEI